MNERGQDRLFAACGIASAVLVHVGLFVGVASGQAFVNLGSSPTRSPMRSPIPRGTGVWVGAYLGCSASAPFSPSRSVGDREARRRPPRRRLPGGRGHRLRLGGQYRRSLRLRRESSSAPGMAWAHSWQPRSPT